MAETPACQADLRLRLTPCPAKPGHTMRYLAAVHNAGPDPAEQVQLTCALPAALIDPHCSSTQFPGPLRWEGRLNLGTLSGGARRLVVLTGTLSPEAHRPLICAAALSSTTPDPVLRNNAVTLATPIASNDE